MQLNIKGKNLEVTDRLRKYVDQKVGKLDRHLPGWSYDEEGPFVSRTLGFRHETDFIHIPA